MRGTSRRRRAPRRQPVTLPRLREPGRGLADPQRACAGLSGRTRGQLPPNGWPSWKQAVGLSRRPVSARAVGVSMEATPPAGPAAAASSGRWRNSAIPGTSSRMKFSFPHNLTSSAQCHSSAFKIPVYVGKVFEPYPDAVAEREMNGRSEIEAESGGVAEAFSEVESARDVEPETVMGPCWYQCAWLGRITPWSQKKERVDLPEGHRACAVLIN
uniref:uncharacterized protein LOC128930759 n=1 Tax=Callithrix jacchus TaxID=9483 RepID=UPI0023DD1EF8|nr:uncharacterized protein LOC128930759 [Callithrix jacchus]